MSIGSPRWPQSPRAGNFGLTLQGAVGSKAELNATVTGVVLEKVSVKPARGLAARRVHGTVSHGRWRISIVLSGVNLDPVPPAT